MKSIQNIAIFGGAECPQESPVFKEVFDTARQLAQQGYTIVNGGGSGVMLAATLGADEGGGKTLTVTFDPKNAPGFDGRYIKNPADENIKTGNYIERMFTLMEHGDAYVIFNGGTGTLSEFGTAWCLARLYFGHHKPFILYGDFWREIIDVIYKHMDMRDCEAKVFKIVNSPEGVLTALAELEQEITPLSPEECQIVGEEKAFMQC